MIIHPPPPGKVMIHHAWTELPAFDESLLYIIYIFFKYYFRIELLTHGLFQIINNKMARTIIIIRIITFTQQRPTRMLETFHRPHAMTRLEWPTGDKNTLFLKTSSSSCSDKVKQNTFSRLQHTHLRVII